MKTFIILFLILLNGNVFAQHNHSSGHSSAPSHPKKEATHSHRAVAEFQAQLREVFTVSLQLNDGLISSDAIKAASIIPDIKAVLLKVDLSLLKEEALMDWMAYLKILNESLDTISNTDNLILQRKALSAFSDALYKSLKEFGTGGIVVYYDYCPMANNNAGAYWLSSSKEIKNPYMGEQNAELRKSKGDISIIVHNFNLTSNTMKMLSVILLIVISMSGHAQQPSVDDVNMVVSTLESYKKAIERLDTVGTGKLFVSKSVVIESGKIEGRYQDYLAHHLEIGRASCRERVLASV